MSEGVLESHGKGDASSCLIHSTSVHPSVDRLASVHVPVDLRTLRDSASTLSATFPHQRGMRLQSRGTTGRGNYRAPLGTAHGVPQGTGWRSTVAAHTEAHSTLPGVLGVTACVALPRAPFVVSSSVCSTASPQSHAPGSTGRLSLGLQSLGRLFHIPSS